MRKVVRWSIACKSISKFLKKNVLPRFEPGKESHNDCTGEIYNDEKRDKSRHNIIRFFFMLLGLHLQLV